MKLDGFTIAAIVFCLGLSFLLSGMEAGVFALNRLRLRQRQRAGDRSAGHLLRYLEEPENFLWTILAGNTLANFFGVALVATYLYSRWGGVQPAMFWGAFGAFIALLYLLGDLLPKRLFQLYPHRFCLPLARPFRFIHLGLSPLVSLVTWFSQGLLSWTGGRTFTGRLFGSRDELRALMRESGQSLSSTERSMIERVLDFQSLTVRQAMQPLDKTVRIPAATPISEVLRLCHERGLTRLLVERAENGRTRIVGVISLKNILYRPPVEATKTAGDFLKSALFLAENLRLEEALRRMQRSGHRLAIVLGPDRQEAGIISLQDILRAIFGEVNL